VQEKPKNKKTSTTTKHPIPIFFIIELLPGAVAGDACGYWGWYEACGESVALANRVPQFAQNFALSGWASPQFGQFISGLL
jgi:hypothetical protein